MTEKPRARHAQADYARRGAAADGQNHREARRLPGIAGRGGGGGGKKGGGGGSTPTEAADNLQSRATAKILDLLCEGEVAGLINDAQSIFFGDTPLMSDAGKENFQGVAWQHVTGTPDQNAIPGFSEIEREVLLNAEVTYEFGPVTQRVSDPDLDAVKIKMRIPQLFKVEADGDIIGSSLTFRVRVMPNNGPNAGQWIDPIISRKWTAFADQTAPESTGLQVTAVDDIPGGRNRFGTYDIRVEYRQVGAAEWLLLGADSGRVKLKPRRREERDKANDR